MTRQSGSSFKNINYIKLYQSVINKPAPEVLIATLGSEAQVVTLTMELLLEMHHNLNEIIVIHTAPQYEPVCSSLKKLKDYFQNQGDHAIPLRSVLIETSHGPVTDIVTEDQVSALFRTMFQEVLTAKTMGNCVHLSIAGGRKTMAVYGMVVGQMLFDDSDHLWHLLSMGKVLEEKRMQMQPGDYVKLIPVPVLRWSVISPVLTDLAYSADPWEALQSQQQIVLRKEWQRKKEFINHVLTPAERQVLKMVARDALSNDAIAHLLHKSIRTVKNHLSHVYEKVHELLGFRDDLVIDRQVVTAEFAPLFVLHENLDDDK